MRLKMRIELRPVPRAALSTGNFLHTRLLAEGE